MNNTKFKNGLVKMPLFFSKSTTTIAENYALRFSSYKCKEDIKSIDQLEELRKYLGNLLIYKHEILLIIKSHIDEPMKEIPLSISESIFDYINACTHYLQQKNKDDENKDHDDTDDDENLFDPYITTKKSENTLDNCFKKIQNIRNI